MDKNDPKQGKREENGLSLTRRKALARLGLAAGAAYAAPLLTGLNRAAADDGGDRPPWGHGSGCHHHGHGGCDD